MSVTVTVGYYTSKEDELVNYTLRDYTRIGWAQQENRHNDSGVLTIYVLIMSTCTHVDVCMRHNNFSESRQELVFSDV